MRGNDYKFFRQACERLRRTQNPKYRPGTLPSSWLHHVWLSALCSKWSGSPLPLRLLLTIRGTSSSPATSHPATQRSRPVSVRPGNAPRLSIPNHNTCTLRSCTPVWPGKHHSQKTRVPRADSTDCPVLECCPSNRARVPLA